jgi:hypothetical protein
MKNKSSTLRGSHEEPVPIVVRSRRNSKLPIVLPAERARLEAEERELSDLRKGKFGRTTPQGRDIMRKVILIARNKLFPKSTEPTSVLHPAAQQLDKAKSDSALRPLAEASQLKGPEPKIPETKTAEVPIKPQADPALGPATQKSQSKSENPRATPTSPALASPAQPGPAQAVPAQAGPAQAGPAQAGPIPARPRNSIQGYSMAEARKLGLV